MPYKDPEKRKAYHKAYMQQYQPGWRKSHPTYGKVYARHWRDTHQGYDKRTLEQHNERAKAYYKRNPEKHRARALLRYAVKMGRIIKPTHCQICRQRSPLQADHHDYTKPYEVLWVCRPCHGDLTIKRNAIGLAL